MGDFGAVILAAGYSSRMKAFKPLLDLGGISALERIVKAMTEAGIGRLVIVTGHDRERIQPVLAELRRRYGEGSAKLPGGAFIVEAYNRDYDRGMFSSIKRGLMAAGQSFSEAAGFFLMPVDCPLISTNVIETLTEQIREAGRPGSPGCPKDASSDEIPREESFFVPIFRGKKGHPLYIPSQYIDEICAFDGQGGLKGITDKYHDRMVRVPVEDEGCVMDMDTPEGYEEIKRFLAAGCRRRPLQELAAGRRIFLVRHGETRQHREKMFIGRYDVPLAENAEADIKKMAQRLAEEKPRVSAIYTSPLQRAQQTARILRDVLHRLETPADRNVPLSIIEDFQEIHLGEWDGKPISWVRERYPEEYDRRGRDIFAFKIGNKAENFYDVQYRAVKALREILEQDGSGDIIIVTHSAVIRALENHLKGLGVEDKWEKIDKNDFKLINL